MKQRFARPLAAALALAALLSIRTLPAPAQQNPDPRVADLVRTGVLRVALQPNIATKDPVTGEWRGVSVDLARELATRLGVTLRPIDYANPAKVLDGIQAGQWDLTFLGVSPERAAVVDFTPPYQETDLTYVVRAGASFRNVADVDRPGVRIAVNASSLVDLVLTRTLKHAELVRVETTAAALDRLRAGTVDAYATNRPGALDTVAQVPGSRMLEDRFSVSLAALAVPKGHPGWLAYFSEFIEQAKASGFVQRAIEREGVRGVQVAPPAANTAEQEVRSLFDRFILAQNDHSLTAVGDLLLDSPRFMWIMGGTHVFGREVGLKRFETAFQGTWHLEPSMEDLQVTSPREDVTLLYVPVVFTIGPAGQTGETTRFVMNQMLVKTEKGWQIASLVIIPVP
jgi:polar amino acid transport system substrate-binding protein